jgi:hypothetical protein
LVKSLTTHGERSWLSASNVSLVRSFLNRGLGILDAGKTNEDDTDAETAASALDTGDETGGDENAIEDGFDPQDPKQSPKAASDLARRRRASDANAIAEAVTTYTEDLREPGRVLDAVDMLRLRAMLTIIIVAGWPGSDDRSYRPSAVQVLPCSDRSHGETWPRLAGRVLAAMFAGANPALKKLRFDKGRELIPDDALEAWAICIWTASAAVAAAKLDPACKALSPILERLVASIKMLLPLSPEEVDSPPFIRTIEAMDRRFSERLRIPVLRNICLNHFAPAKPNSEDSLARF